MPDTTTNAGSAATGVDIASGTGLAQVIAQIAQMMAQIRGTNSATAGVMDPRLLTGSQSTDLSGYIPTLANQQFQQTKMDADRQYALDVDKYGLSVAQFNYQQRLQSAQLSLDTLTKMATLNGPKDQIAYQYALKGLQAPAPTSQTNVGDPNGLLGGLAKPGAQGVNQPYGGGSTLTSRAVAAPGTLNPADAMAKATNLSALWNAGRFDEFRAAGGTAATPAPADQWGAGAPGADQHPEVNGIQGAGWTPDTYTDSPYQAGADTSVQHADLPGGGQVSWDPNAPGNGIPGYAHGGLLEGVAQDGPPTMPPPQPGGDAGSPPNPLEDANGELNWDGDHMPTNSGDGLLGDVESDGALIASIVRHMRAPGPTNAGGGAPEAVVGDVPGKITGGEELATALPPENGQSRFAVQPLSMSKDPAEVAAKMPPQVQRAALGGIFGDTNINSNGTGGPGTAPSGAVYSPEAIGSQPAVQALTNPTVKQPAFTGFGGGLSNPDYGLLDLPSAPSAQALESLLPSQWDTVQSAYEQGVGADFRDILAQSAKASPVGSRGYRASVYGN